MSWHPTEKQSRPRVPGKGIPRGTPVGILKTWPWFASVQDQQLLPEAKIVCDQQRLWSDSRAIAHSKQRNIDLSPWC
jgi:hypothetical protein